MATVESSVRIERPQSEVFDYLADITRHHEWNTALDRTEVVGSGPVGLGTQAVEIRRVLRWEMRSPFVITRHEPPTRQDFHTTGGPVRPDGVLRCVDEGGVTRVSYELTLRGPFAKLIAVGLRRGMPGNLANVKKILEERS